MLASDVDAALEVARETGSEEAFVIGGATVYEVFLDRADRLVLTELDEAYDGDTEFPAWPPGQVWIEADREERDGFAFVTYERSL